MKHYIQTLRAFHILIQKQRIALYGHLIQINQAYPQSEYLIETHVQWFMEVKRDLADKVAGLAVHERVMYWENEQVKRGRS